MLLCGQTTGSYRLDMFRAGTSDGPVTTEVPQSLLDVLKALVLSAKADRMPTWLTDMVVLELCKVLLQQQRALTIQFAAQPEETEDEVRSTGRFRPARISVMQLPFPDNVTRTNIKIKHVCVSYTIHTRSEDSTPLLCRCGERLLPVGVCGDAVAGGSANIERTQQP